MEDSVRRNALREGRARIADVAIFAVAKQPCAVQATEGFDQRFEVRLTETGAVVTEILPTAPHHTP